MSCLYCEDTGWVCEAHPDQPWDGPHACTCGAAGAPCPACNRSTRDEPPRLPKGFEPDGEQAGCSSLTRGPNFGERGEAQHYPAGFPYRFQPLNSRQGERPSAEDASPPTEAVYSLIARSIYA